MDRPVPVATRETLNEENVEDRVWHAGYVQTNESLCGVEGEWVGVGHVVTCKECRKLMRKFRE